MADSDNWSTTVPAITVALRGNVTFRLTVATLAHASHSGMLGGAVPDAMLAMVKLLATLHDDDGSVAVAGLTSREAAVPGVRSEKQLREETGLLEGVTPIGRGPILSRLWSQPSITVTGIDAPVRRQRVEHPAPRGLGADQRPHRSRPDGGVRLRSPRGASARARAVRCAREIDDVDRGNPFLVDTSGWAIAEATVAMTEGWGAEPVQTGIGGSIPFIADLVETFPEAQILVTGVEDPDTRAHSPNESQHLGVLPPGDPQRGDPAGAGSTRATDDDPAAGRPSRNKCRGTCCLHWTQTSAPRSDLSKEAP